MMLKPNKHFSVFMVIVLFLSACSLFDPKLDDDDSQLKTRLAQMIQAERGNLNAGEQMDFQFGSVLSGGGSVPNPNTPQGWIEMIDRYQMVSDIPIIYGADAVHGHNNVEGATIFPHNIGLGATNDPDLVKKIGVAVGEEMLATGVHWNFAPCLAVVQDIRWGRTYESYSEDSGIVSILGTSYIQGLQSTGIAASAKHYFADGGTLSGTSVRYNIDQGDVILSEEDLRRIHLYPYLSAINEADVLTIMVSFSSIDGVKMSESTYWITDVLKGELGFKGMVVSDWEAIHQLEGSLYDQVVKSINAGIDMLMEPNESKAVLDNLFKAVKNGDILMSRIEDALNRINFVKQELRLLNDSFPDSNPNLFNSVEHRQLAAEAVSKSLVLLKNEDILPLRKDMDILLIGPGADNAGLASGGWTITWQGQDNGSKFPQATTLLEAFKSVANQNGGSVTTNPSKIDSVDIVVLALAEMPYAEGEGDAVDLKLDGDFMHPDNTKAIEFAKNSNKPVITILSAGRPRIITSELEDWDAFVMAWLYGTEAQGITEVLYGDRDFTGKLPVTWPKSNDTFSLSSMNPDRDTTNILFDFGYGLTTSRPGQ